jgi:hypothetical protein
MPNAGGRCGGGGGSRSPCTNPHTLAASHSLAAHACADTDRRPTPDAQIDTRNRDCGVTPESVTNCTPGKHGFTPGPEPKQARYGRGIPESGPLSQYSGVLECPCTSDFGGDIQVGPAAAAGESAVEQHGGGGAGGGGGVGGPNAG